MDFLHKILPKTLESWLETIIKIIIPIILFLPLLINEDFYFPFITPRNFAFRILVSIALAIYLFLYFNNRNKYKMPANKLFLSYIAFALIMTVASLINGDFMYSFWSNSERMEGLLGLYYIVAFLWVILSIYGRKKAWLDLIRFSAWISILIAVIAISQRWGVNLLIDSSSGDRISATLGNPTYLAGYALFSMSFLLYLLFKDRHRRLKIELWSFYVLDILLVIFALKSGSSSTLVTIFKSFSLLFIFIVLQFFVNLQYYLYKKNYKISRAGMIGYYVFGIVFNFFALFYTQTRGVLVGIFVAVVAVAIFLLISRHVSKKIKYVVGLAIVLVGLLVSSIFIFKESNFIKYNATLNRVASISVSDTTTETRLLTWQLSLKAFAEKPILGWGEERFLVVFNKYFPTEIYKNSGSRVWFDRPHNVFLQQLVHGGVLGLLAYLSIFIFAFKNLWQHYRRSHDVKTISIFGGLLIAYLVQDFFVFDSLNTYIPLVITLSAIVFIGSKEKKSVNENSKTSWPIGLVIALLILIVGYSVTIPQAQANHKFIKNYRALLAMGYDADINDEVIDAINSHYLGKFEFRQVYVEYAQNVLSDINMPAEIRQKVFLTTKNELIKTLAQQPDNVRNHSFLISLYMMVAPTNAEYAIEAIDLIENEALPLSPTRTSLYYSLGSLYMGVGDFDKANENFLKAKELSPHVFESYLNLFLNYISVGDEERANRALADMYENVSSIKPDNYARLADIYNFFDEGDKAVAMLERALAEYPEDMRILSQLVYYCQALDRSEDVQHYLDEIKKIDPAFAEAIGSSISL